MDGVFKINELGVMILQADEEFQHATKLRNPFKVQQDLFSKRTTQYENGSFSVRPPTKEESKLEPSKEEIRNYINEKDLFIGDKIFKNCSYDDFLKYKKMHPNLEFHYKPCEGISGQCSFDCDMIGECPYAV